MATSLTSEYENDVIEGKSRVEIIEELEDLGVVTTALSMLSDGELQDLLCSLGGLVDAHASRRGRPRADSDGPIVLSQVDKKILASFSPSGATSPRFRCQKSWACRSARCSGGRRGLRRT